MVLWLGWPRRYSRNGKVYGVLSNKHFVQLDFMKWSVILSGLASIVEPMALNMCQVSTNNSMWLSVGTRQCAWQPFQIWNSVNCSLVAMRVSQHQQLLCFILLQLQNNPHLSVLVGFAATSVCCLSSCLHCCVSVHWYACCKEKDQEDLEWEWGPQTQLATSHISSQLQILYCALTSKTGRSCAKSVFLAMETLHSGVKFLQTATSSVPTVLTCTVHASQWVSLAIDIWNGEIKWVLASGIGRHHPHCHPSFRKL